MKDINQYRLEKLEDRMDSLEKSNQEIISKLDILIAKKEIEEKDKTLRFETIKLIAGFFGGVLATALGFYLNSIYPKSPEQPVIQNPSIQKTK